MHRLTRRRLLRAGGAVTAGGLAGCLADADPTGEGPPEDPQTTDPPDDPVPMPGDPDSLTDWERSTDCHRRHDSVLRVERTTSDLGDEYDPIAFADLSAGEREILAAVTAEGGDGTCDPPGAFDTFLDRVREHGERQAADRNRVYLERDGTYYGLYVEWGDQVYAY